MKKLKIAFIGLKGIPAKWGGIEVYVQEIAKRLARRGHLVSVYSRKWYVGNRDSYAGIRIVRTPTIKTKSTDALLHGMTASIHAASSDFDIVHYHGLASFFSAILPKISGKKIVITFHAASWVEPKWNKFAGKSLEAATNLGMKVAHAATTISPVLQEFLATISKREVTLTPPGMNIGIYREPNNIYRDYGLRANSYLLFMGRLDTVKRIDLLLKAFKSIKCPTMNLVIAGDPGPSDGFEYKDQLLETAKDDKRIIFTGFQSGITKEELLSNCFLFVLPSLNEGVPVVLLEGMSYGRPCLASDIPAHQHVISDGVNGFLANGDLFEDFRQKLAAIINLDGNTLDRIGRNALETVYNTFNWDNTVDRLEEVYYNLVPQPIMNVREIDI